MPEAPERLSTITDCCQASLAICANFLAVKSVPAPGAVGTIHLIGLLGKSLTKVAELPAAKHPKDSAVANPKKHSLKT